MKRLTALLLVLVLAFSLIACEPSETKDPSKDTSESGQEIEQSDESTAENGDDLGNSTGEDTQKNGDKQIGEDTDTHEWGSISNMTPIY